MLQGSHLTVGSRDLSRTVSGVISDGFTPGGMLTKVGTGTLTLAGENAYTGLTTVARGTLSRRWRHCRRCARQEWRQAGGQGSHPAHARC